MRNFPDTYETRKRSFTSAFSIRMTVPLRRITENQKQSLVGVPKTIEAAIGVVL